MLDLSFKDWFLQHGPGLHEMPITDFQLMGKWGPKDLPRGYTKQDIGILTNPKAVEKIHKQWSNTKQNFDLYFLRSPKAHKHLQVGLVTPDWVKQNLQVDIKPNPNNVTVIFTQNKGDQKIPMTGWAIAHRLGHALIRDRTVGLGFANGPIGRFFSRVQQDFDRMTQQLFPNSRPDVYGRYDKNQIKPVHLAYAVGTMKSARDRNLTRFGEFTFELFAQYLLTGKIKFNPLPRSIIRRNHMAWGRSAPQTNWAQDETAFYKVHTKLQNLPAEYEYELDEALDGLEGQMLVM